MSGVVVGLGRLGYTGQIVAQNRERFLARNSPWLRLATGLPDTKQGEESFREIFGLLKADIMELAGEERQTKLIAVVAWCLVQELSISEILERLQPENELEAKQCGPNYNENLLTALVTVIVSGNDNILLLNMVGEELHKATASIASAEERGRILGKATSNCADTCKRGRILRLAVETFAPDVRGRILGAATADLDPIRRGEVLRYSAANLRVENLGIALGAATEDLEPKARGVVLRYVLTENCLTPDLCLQVTKVRKVGEQEVHLTQYFGQSNFNAIGTTLGFATLDISDQETFEIVLAEAAAGLRLHPEMHEVVRQTAQMYFSGSRG